MDIKIVKMLDIAKDKLNLDLTSIVYGELSKGNSSIINENEKLNEYFEFLKHCDGARFGGIDLWSYEELPSNQYRCADLCKGEQLLEIGQILYEPLVINKINGEVGYLSQDKPNEIKYRFGSFNNFLINYVFGIKYSEIIPDSHEDNWFDFIQTLNKIQL